MEGVWGKNEPSQDTTQYPEAKCKFECSKLHTEFRSTVNYHAKLWDQLDF